MLLLWDVSGGNEPRSFRGHWGKVGGVAIAPDGRTALSGSDDKTLKLWDPATGKELRNFSGHHDYVQQVAIAPDGLTAISNSWDQTQKVWDLTTGKELHSFTDRNHRTIAPDGRTVLSGSTDGSLKLWDLASGRVLRKFTEYSGAASTLAISPDGRTALSGSNDKTLRLWDLTSGKELRTFDGQPWVSLVRIAADGQTALSASDRTVTLWDLASGRELRTFNGHSGEVWSIAIAPDGRMAISGGVDKTLKLWDLATGKELRTFNGHSDVVSSVAIAPDGRSVISGSYDKTLKLWDFSRGIAQRAFEPRVAAAQATLQKAPGDPGALAILGAWYAFRGMDHWAVDLLCRARVRGAAVAPLTLARSYWKLSRNGDARREFQIAVEQSKDQKELTYLRWCIEAIDTEPERKRQNDAARDLIARAERANLLALTGKATEAVVEVAELTKSQIWSSGEWYNFACVYSLASAKIADKKKDYSDRTMDMLHKAVMAGWNNTGHAARDTDLDPLRNREDFKKMLADLENAAAQAAKKP
jgi:WD domain, G-beta repeat